MAIQSAIGAYLLSNAALLAAIPNDEGGAPAIYPVRGLQDSRADPYIIFRVAGWNEITPLTSPVPFGTAQVIVSCYSLNYDTAASVAKLVILALRYLNGVSMGTELAQGSWIVSMRDEDQSDAGVYEIVVEANIQFAQ